MDEMGDDVLEERQRGKHLTFFAYHYILVHVVTNYEFSGEHTIPVFLLSADGIYYQLVASQVCF